MPKRNRHTRRPINCIDGFGEMTTQISRAAALRSVGEVVYAIRCGDVIKIGHTTNLAVRANALGSTDILAFVPGTYADEQEIHSRLTAHLEHGREWYHPTSEVLAVVNDMREGLGLPQLAA